MRKTKEEAEKTNELILKAAIKVISEKGYSSTRMEDIAKQAEVTRGAIYHYYKNKNAILYDIHSKNKNRINVLMQKLENSKNDPIQIMKDSFVELFERFENDEEFRTIEEVFLKIEFAAIMKEDEELRERFQNDMCENQSRLQKIIKIGQEKGSIRNDIDPKNLALTIMSFYIGITTLWFINIIDFSIKEKASDYVDVLFNGIKNNYKL
ncbi:MAG: TetR family transcriptional regulator [Ignavibacteriae bacterium]|nr:TetR family transcriptional regulator [Ignavibacteriota bacterium]